MPTVVDRARVQELLREGAQLVEVLPQPEYGRPVVVYCHDYQ
jgi:hypothetical protein